MDRENQIGLLFRCAKGVKMKNKSQLKKKSDILNMTLIIKITFLAGILK